MNTITRRAFVKTSLAASAAFSVLPGGRAASPNEKILIGVMGSGGRGSYLAQAFAKRQDAEIAWLCDPDSRTKLALDAKTETFVGAPEANQHLKRAYRAPWLDSFAQRMPEEFVKKFDQLGGVWPEGPNHGGVCYAPFITWEAWRFATGQKT